MFATTTRIPTGRLAAAALALCRVGFNLHSEAVKITYSAVSSRGEGRWVLRYFLRLCRVALSYDGKEIIVAGSGEDYAEFLELCEGKHSCLVGDHFQSVRSELMAFFVYIYADGERIYGYVRFETGDEMSRRKKFAFLTWIGPSVSPLKKAKVSTDKAFVKKIFVVSLIVEKTSVGLKCSECQHQA